MDRKKFSKKKPQKFKKQPVKLYKKNVSKRELFLQEVEQLKKRYEEIDSNTTFETFEQLPLSSQTQKGLKQNGYISLTDIQRESIILALKGHDILGAAKTGSGKTLAFVIPVLECLFREGWCRPAGLGALVITPTRELAYQIFNVFKKVGKFHDFTVALVIGGKDHEIEKQVFNQFNVIICTPGRLLEHMDQNPLFDGVNLQILVLDEADRILDMGFAETMDAIINSLPLERQTLLFSATQTRSVKDLGRLSLKDPKYVSVHEHAKYITPESLTQSYIIMEAEDKINFIWSFLRKHKKQKILVFMATCKEVQYVFHVFCQLRPGISVTALYGRLHQLKRMEKYNSFCQKQHAVMFATDIAARGLDFPNVNWVIQLDCPEDVNTYIHRAGRTARFSQGGDSLLVLSPSEKDSMVQQMEARRIPISEIQVNPRELSSITKKLTTMCTTNQETLESAKRAFGAYLKNIFLMKDKTVFDVQKINKEAYARSLGLLVAPRTRFIDKHLKIKAASQPTSLISEKDSKSLDSEIGSKSVVNTSARGSEGENLKKKNLDTIFQLSEDPDESENFVQAKSHSVLEASARSTGTDSEDEGEVAQVVPGKDKTLELDAVWDTAGSLDECFFPLEVTRVYAVGELAGGQEGIKKPITKYAMAKKILKNNPTPNIKIRFDEEEESTVGGLNMKVPSRTILPDGNNITIEFIKKLIAEADKKDKVAYQKKLREKRIEKKMKLKELKEKLKKAAAEEYELLNDSQDVSSKQREYKSKQYIKELPDPDKYYAKDSERESDEDTEQSLSARFSNYDNDETVESLSEEEEPKQKQKRSKKEKIGSSRKKQKLSEELPGGKKATLALNDDEELALTLLHGS